MAKYVGDDTKVMACRELVTCEDSCQVRHGPPPFVMPEVEVTPPRPPMVLPKYQRFSCDHMSGCLALASLPMRLPLEMNPGASETGQFQMLTRS